MIALDRILCNEVYHFLLKGHGQIAIPEDESEPEYDKLLSIHSRFGRIQSRF
jgi:hypothetical protein